VDAGAEDVVEDVVEVRAVDVAEAKRKRSRLVAEI
tara:strand:+ start:1005 stop:1109 length:105 start_codon:yes stop_codon:yes gene_type:complete